MGHSKIGCGAKLSMWTPGGREYSIKCGTMGAYRTELCPDCRKLAASRYPQGWRNYPGDTCKHGTYVGGCGVDWICVLCEMGEG